MRIEFLKSFEKSIKNLSKSDKTKVFQSCRALIDFIEQETVGSRGLGFKRLQSNFWEVRAGLKLRIIFQWKKDYLQFILAGNHDDIKKFLKQNR